jgi:hypothetical protein
MKGKDAFYLLFHEDFGDGPLFRNQSQLAHELIKHPGSIYYTEGDGEEFNRQLNRVKAFLSQVFSQGSRRTVNDGFIRSLQGVIAKRNLSAEKVHYLVKLIADDLRSRNQKNRTFPTVRRDTSTTAEQFLFHLDRAEYISVFSSREIQLSDAHSVSLIYFLLEDFFENLREQEIRKRYKFNFPSHQKCLLFWKSLETHMKEYVIHNKERLLAVLHHLPDMHYGAELFEPDPAVITVRLLRDFSERRVFSVFLLEAPVYLAPTITFDPLDSAFGATYLFLQALDGKDHLHRLSESEFFSWKHFVFDHLRIYHEGQHIPYAPQSPNYPGEK